MTCLSKTSSLTIEWTHISTSPWRFTRCPIKDFLARIQAAEQETEQIIAQAVEQGRIRQEQAARQPSGGHSLPQ
jgi:hypothetical protein